MYLHVKSTWASWSSQPTTASNGTKRVSWIRFMTTPRSGFSGTKVSPLDSNKLGWKISEQAGNQRSDSAINVGVLLPRSIAEEEDHRPTVQRRIKFSEAAQSPAIGCHPVLTALIE